jgi:hypothetical protein
VRAAANPAECGRDRRLGRQLVGAAVDCWGGAGLLVLGSWLYFRIGTVSREPVEVRAPVAGLWSAVYAPASGRVVRAHGTERDHRSRTSIPAMVWLVIDSVRELAGPGKILGDHVVIEIEDGIFAVLAHLRQGSLNVAKGDVVTVGTQVGSCGNSGKHPRSRSDDGPSATA